MIGNAIKKYLKNAINKTNNENVPCEIPNIERKYSKLPFIRMYSKVTQNKTLVNNFAKLPKLN